MRVLILALAMLLSFASAGSAMIYVDAGDTGHAPTPHQHHSAPRAR